MTMALSQAGDQHAQKDFGEALHGVSVDRPMASWAVGHDDRPGVRKEAA